eukprot:735003-Pyramimonas_sp.AAC.1
MLRSTSLPALCCRFLSENEIYVPVQYPCPKGCGLRVLSFLSSACFATLFNAAHLRTWGRAPDGITLWSILLVLICSSFTQLYVGPQSMKVATTEN